MAQEVDTGGSAPRPFGQVVRELPGQYLKVLTRPSKETFTHEMDKASWSGVWVQLFALVIITSLIAWLGSLIVPPFNTHTVPGRLNMLLIQQFVGISAGNLLLNLITQLITQPLVFFLVASIIHLLAKAFGGHGRYLALAYTYLLVSVPLTCIIGLLALIPLLGWLFVLAGDIYSVILYIFILMAVYRLSGGRATTMVVIPMVLLVFIVVWLNFIR